MLVWVIFIAVIILFLALDLGVFHKTPHVISTKEAATWTTIWVTVALGFSGVIYWLFTNNIIENPTDLTGQEAVLKYITGYLVELSLSIDNVFVIAIIFSSFAIPQKYQHEVLFWGILGAIVFRAIVIFFGVTLINKVDWIVYVFGAFLLFTAYRILVSKEGSFNPKKSKTYKIIKRTFALTDTFDGGKFFIKRMGVKVATPLFAALIVIELTDIVFALDSIPAILAITSDPFIVFSSNIMAILGLRSLYFLVSRMLDKFRFLNYSLVIILGYVGIKLILSHTVEIPEWVSLSVIAGSLLGGIVFSLIIPVNNSEDVVDS